MADRVVVFIDYQNVYMGARDTFLPWDSPHQDGQIDPWRLGELITSRGLGERSLAAVRIYRGQPDAVREPRGYAACDRQCARWRQQPGTFVVTRTLRYPREWPHAKAQEKGIDVAIAVDYVAMAVRNEYDIGILMSVDTDLKPAIEFVSKLSAPRLRCEVAAWSSPRGHSRRLAIAGRNVWCHWLDTLDYRAVADRTNYAQPAAW